MAQHAQPVSIVRCRATKHGLLILFSDGQVHLFHNSFLVQNRLQHGDRVVNNKAILAMLAEAKPTPVDEGPVERSGELGVN
jgi:hypothetical protein